MLTRVRTPSDLPSLLTVQVSILTAMGLVACGSEVNVDTASVSTGFLASGALGAIRRQAIAAVVAPCAKALLHRPELTDRPTAIV